MPTTPSDVRRPRRTAGIALLGLVLPLALAACSGEAPTAPTPGVVAQQPGEAEGRVRGADAAPRSVARGIERALARRADAVRRGDRTAFVAGVDPGSPELRAAQDSYFSNLAKLPVGEFGYRLDRGSLVRDGDAYWGVVDVTLELAGFDEQPVVTRDRYRFTPDPDATGRAGYLLASTTDPDWERVHEVDPQPWEAGPLTVRVRNGALGLFDAGSVASADRVMREVAGGISAVAAELPYDWDRRVVVYALSDPTFLAGLDGVPGGDALALDAVTFPVPAAPGSAEVADTRFVLNPRMLAEPELERGRLIRHELTHVALGDRQDGVPTWFSEGLAEYVSVRPLAPERRAVAGAALAAAEAGPTSLPEDGTFNGPEAQAHYGLAWWAVEYLADTYDESVLWLLLDAMTGAAEPDQVLDAVLQLDAETLARRSARLLVATYAPEPEPSPSGSESPSGSPATSPSGSSSPSSSPSGAPTASPSSEDGR